MGGRGERLGCLRGHLQSMNEEQELETKYPASKGLGGTTVRCAPHGLRGLPGGLCPCYLYSAPICS